MRETPQALQAFECYWAMGDGRSLDRVAQELAKSLPLVKRWSAEHGWQGRVKARIAEQAAAVAAEQAKQLAEIKAQLVRDGIEAERLAMETLRSLAATQKLGAMAAVMMLPQARAAMLRGMDQPETVARQEMTGKDGAPVVFTIEIDRRDADVPASLDS